MRIAYVTLHWPRTAASSTGKKIIQHMEHWRNAGHEVKFFSHMHEMEQPEDLVEGTYYSYGIKRGFFGRIQTELSRIKAVKKMIAAVKDYHPDIIYLRWSIYVFPVQRLLLIAPSILEINTNDVEEHKHLGFLKYLYNRLTRWMVYRFSSGMVFVTNELSKLNVFQKFKKPFCVIGNGINISETVFFEPPNNRIPRLLFLGTEGMIWHGVEKLIFFSREYPDVIVDVVGFEDVQIKENLPKNLVLHGFLTGNSLDQILEKTDCAIGTMSLYQKGLTEASPIKTRQYLASGIPSILPYCDTDLKDLNTEFILRIPNHRNNIQTHGQEIHDFVYAMRGKRVPRNLIFDRLDSSVKETERLRFFARILKQT